MTGHVLIMSKRTQLVAALVILTGAVVALVCLIVIAEGAYDRGRRAGYQAGYADAARVACTTPGEVSGLCWSLTPQLPECEHEDGTPEGCLRRDIDGASAWVVGD